MKGEGGREGVWTMKKETSQKRREGEGEGGNEKGRPKRRGGEGK